MILTALPFPLSPQLYSPPHADTGVAGLCDADSAVGEGPERIRSCELLSLRAVPARLDRVKDGSC